MSNAFGGEPPHSVDDTRSPIQIISRGQIRDGSVRNRDFGFTERNTCFSPTHKLFSLKNRAYPSVRNAKTILRHQL